MTKDNSRCLKIVITSPSNTFNNVLILIILMHPLIIIFFLSFVLLCEEFHVPTNEDLTRLFLLSFVVSMYLFGSPKRFFLGISVDQRKSFYKGLFIINICRTRPVLEYSITSKEA